MRTLTAFCDICGSMIPHGEPMPASIILREESKVVRLDMCRQCTEDLVASFNEVAAKDGRAQCDYRTSR